MNFDWTDRSIRPTVASYLAPQEAPMALDPLAPSTGQATATVEPSRAWILGLVVEPDGSLSGPGSERTREWPSCACLDECAVDHEDA